MKFKFSFLSLLMSIFLIVGISTLNMNGKRENNSIVTKDYENVDRPDAFIDTNIFSKDTDKIYLDYANITDTVFSKAKIERKIVNISNSGLFGGEIIRKGTTIGDYTFDHDSRVLKVKNSEVLIDLLDNTFVTFNIPLNSFPIDTEKTKITTYFGTGKVSYKNIPIINFLKDKLEYQIELNIQNDGNIYHGDQIKAEIVTSSCYIGGLLIKNSYIHEVNGKNKVVVSTFYNGKEYCEYKDINIIRTFGSISEINGENLKVGLKVYKLK